MNSKCEHSATGRACWEHFPHGSDIGVRGRGPTLNAAFEQAALATTAVITDPANVAAQIAVEIRAEAPNAEILLLDWLNCLIFEMATRRMLFGSFDVLVEGKHLSAVARGEHVSRQRHSPAVEIKGATMTELFVGEDGPGMWRAQCVVDV